MLLIKKEEELQYDEKGDAYLDRTGNLYGADNGDVGGCSSGKESTGTDSAKTEDTKGEETAEGDVIKIISAGNNPEEHFQSIAMGCV